MQYDNPAARLLAILSAGQKVNGTNPCKVVWANLLDAPHEDLPLLISLIGKLMCLPQEIIALTKENYPNRAPTWEHWSAQVNTAFATQDLNGQWRTFIHNIDAHTINYLSMSAELLEAKSSIKRLDSETTTELRARVNDLLNLVIESEIDASFKKYIVRHLRQILAAIDEYKITGALPILDAVESTIGHAYLDKRYYDFLKNTDIGMQLCQALAAVANLVTIAVGLPQLGHALLQLTGSG